jgi:hydroxymethylpyrimidine pyrophosphatase-like HAD family hydrolase
MEPKGDITQPPERHTERKISPDVSNKRFEAYFTAKGLKITNKSCLGPQDNLPDGFIYPDINAVSEREAQFQRNENNKARALELIGIQRTPLVERNIIGIINPEINGDGEITFSTKPLTNAIQYDPVLRLTEPTQEAARLREAIGSPLAGNIMLRTKDGKLIFQHRSGQNRTYFDIPQGSAGGYIPNDLDENGVLKPIDEDHIKKSIAKIASEELGIDEAHIKNIIISGYAEEKIRCHSEFLHFGEVDLTAEEVIKSSLINARKNFKEARSNIREQFIILDATTENLMKLLTKSRCPMSPTHYALVLATLKIIATEEFGEEHANKLMSVVQFGLEQNIEVQDSIVKRATEETLKLEAYSPSHFPFEQGLPSMEEEFSRLKLTEKIRRPRIVNFWDVDGPIVDPATKEITPLGYKIINTIAMLIDKGCPQILNTGRAVEWLSEGDHNVIKAIEDAVLDKSKLEDSFLAIGEFGGTMMFYKDNEWHVEYNKTVAVPNDIQQEIKEAINNNPDYNQFACFEEGKHVQLSITQPDPPKDTPKEQAEEIKKETLRKFREKREDIAKIIRGVLKKHGNPDFALLITATGVDLCPPGFGKAFGAEIGAEWLDENNIIPMLVYIFGDSPSDLKMVEPLQERYPIVKSGFVGDVELTEEHQAGLKIPAEIPVGFFNEGVLEILQKIFGTGYV